MERVFTKDVLRSDGTVKFRRGEIRDFGKSTWQQIAESSGMRRMENFSVTKTAAAVAGVSAGATAPASDGDGGSKSAKSRRRIAA